MHDAERRIDRDQFDIELRQQVGDLRDGGVVGAQAAADHCGFLVDPHQVGAFEGTGAGQGLQDRDAEVGELARDPALLGGAHGRRRPRQDGALRGHDEQVGAEHQVRLAR